MAAENFKTTEIPYRKPRHLLGRVVRFLMTGDLNADRPNERRIVSIIADEELVGYALQRRTDDTLNRKTILRFVPLDIVLEDRLQNAEIPFRRKITPRTVLVWFYSILFMFLPWDLDDVEMVPDERNISKLILHRAERGYDLVRREDDHLNLKTVLKFESHAAKLET